MALLKAEKVLERAGLAGADWDDPASVNTLYVASTKFWPHTVRSDRDADADSDADTCHNTYATVAVSASVSAWGPFWPPMPRPRLLLPRPPGEGGVGFP